MRRAAAGRSESVARVRYLGALTALFTVLGWGALVVPAYAAGPAANVSVTLSPNPVAANGSSTTTVTATVTDSGTNPVAGDTLTFTSSDPGDQIGPVTDNGNGTYTATITSSSTPGQPTITATDSSVTPNVSGSATLIQTGPAAQVTLTMTPSAIAADGSSTSTATATVTDAAGNPVAGDTVNFSTTDAHQNIGPVTEHSNGTYTATVTSSTTPGQPTITATDISVTPNVSGSATLTQTPGPAANVSIQLSPPSITADGSSTTQATATVTDAHGNRIAGDPVAITSSDPGDQIGPVANNGNGTYTATITSSTTPGQPTITATDSSVTPSVSGSATLTQTPGPAANVSVQLSPNSITANGSSTSTATVTVTDAHGNRIAGDPIAITSSDPGDQIGPVTDNGNGTYTATITSSTTAGQPTITATDSSVSGSATLNQTPGPARNINFVQISPNLIPADSTSTSTITVLVSDVHGNPVPNATVTLASTDKHQIISQVTNNNNGTYTFTVTASATAGTATLTASVAPTLTQTASLKQIASSTTAFAAFSSGPAANQSVNLVATVTSSVQNLFPSGTVTFTSNGNPISGCANLPVISSGQSVTTTCQTSFAAGSVNLAAVFSSSNANLAGSSSRPPSTLSVRQDPTSTALDVSSPSIGSGQSVTYTATVAPQDSGAAQPSGSVQFLDGGQPIGSCLNQPLSGSGLTATCTVKYQTPGSHTITARYTGDTNFASSTSQAQAVTVQAPAPPAIQGTIAATMQWTFYFAPSYTKVLALHVNAAPVGSSVIVLCHGKGCPFARRATTIVRGSICTSSGGKKHHKKSTCSQPSHMLDLSSSFSNRRLKPGAQITVEIVRASWVGKYYMFKMVPKRSPRVQIECLAPGSSKPGVGC